MQARHHAETEKPDLQEFGVTAEEYNLYARNFNDGEIGYSVALISLAIVVPPTAWAVWIVSIAGEWTGAGLIAFFSLVLGFPIVGMVIKAGTSRYKRIRLLKSPIVRHIKAYEEATVAYLETQEKDKRQRIEVERVQQEAERQRREAEKARLAALRAEQRKREQYWKSLGGIEFERELAKLYRARGYQVEFTPVSGDQGVDLILRNNGKTTVVQCKAQKRPASPNVIRDLYGSMLHHKADNAILACTGGFSGNVVKFAQGKPIELISAWHISRMAEESGDEMHDMTESSPICPKHGCGRMMVLRNGRRGRFWGCPSYPNCRGTRDF